MNRKPTNNFAGQSPCVAVAVAATLLVSACKAPQRTGSRNPAEGEMASLLMPSRIDIVEPFTQVRDFDKDGALDGIELLMQAVNALDNPGLQIVGNVRIELFEFVEASAEPRGARIDRWDVDLSSVELQKKHWNQLTQMYEFRLAVDPSRLPRKRKFVLAVTYNTPQGEHLNDQSILEYDLSGVVGSG